MLFPLLYALLSGTVAGQVCSCLHWRCKSKTEKNFTLTILRPVLTVYSTHAFRISAPRVLNLLPPHILQSQTLSSFRRHLKAHYFQSIYPPLAPSPMCPDFLLSIWSHINCLLTYYNNYLTSHSDVIFTARQHSLLCRALY